MKEMFLLLQWDISGLSTDGPYESATIARANINPDLGEHAIVVGPLPVVEVIELDKEFGVKTTAWQACGKQKT